MPDTLEDPRTTTDFDGNHDNLPGVNLPLDKELGEMVYSDAPVYMGNEEGDPDLSKMESGDGINREENPDAGDPQSEYSYGPDNSELSSLSVGTKTKKRRGMLFTYATGLIIGGSISGMGLLTFLLPQAVLSWIETKIDAVTNQMVDKATDRMLSSYLKNVVGPRAKKCGNTVDLTCTAKVSGDGYIRGVFRTIQQAQADDLLAKRGVFISYNKNANGGVGSYKVITPKNPAGFDITDVGPDSFDFDRFNDAGPREAYKAIKAELKLAFNEEGKIKKFLKVRYHLGVLEEKYKLKKCSILCKETDNAARKIVDNKIINKYKALKVRLVTKLNARTGIFLDCMMKGGCADVDFNSDSDGIKSALKDVGLDADNLDGIDFKNVNFKKLAEDLEYAESRALKGGLLDAIKIRKELFMKKILTTFFKKLGVEAPEELAEKIGTEAIPVIGQVLFVVMIVDFISRLESGITSPDGWFVKSVNAVKAADMVDAYSLLTQSTSELKLGGLSMAESGSLIKDLSGLGTSRIFQGMILGKTGADLNKYQENCPNSKRIEDGKPICQEYAMNYLPEIAQIYANSPLSTIVNVLGLSEYRNSPLGIPGTGALIEVIGIDTVLPDFLKNSECVRASICDLYRSLMGAVNWAFDKVIDSIPGVPQLLDMLAGFASDIFDKFGISGFFMDMLAKIAPKSDCSDTISSSNVNCVFGGAFRVTMDSNKNNFGAPKQDSLTFKKEYYLAISDQVDKFKNLGFKERLFGLDNPRSLTSRFVQNTIFNNNKLASLAFNPNKQLSFAFDSFSSNVFFNPPAYAQDLSQQEAEFANSFNDDVFFWSSNQIESASLVDVENCGINNAFQHETCPLYKGLAELLSSNYLKADSGSGGSNGSSSESSSSFVDGQRGACPGVTSTRPNSGKPKNNVPIQRVPGTTIDMFEGYCMNTLDMVNAAKNDGVILNGFGFRTYDQQVETRKANGCGSSYYEIYEAPARSCKTPTAKPGFSEHEKGLAIDFSTGKASIDKDSVQFKWLSLNAGKYGFKNLPSEPWHWSSNGK